MRRRFVKDLPQPNLRQTSNGIVILRERLSLLWQDNFVSLARRRLRGAQAGSDRCPLQELSRSQDWLTRIVLRQ